MWRRSCKTFFYVGFIFSLYISSPLFGVWLADDNVQVPEGQRPSDNVMARRVSGVGSYVVINPNFIVGASHCAVNPGELMYIGRDTSQQYQIVERRIWSDTTNDIAVYRIAQTDNTPTDFTDNPPANLAEYVDLYCFNDELGKEIVIGGYGYGNGNETLGTLRWGKNVIDVIYDGTFSFTYSLTDDWVVDYEARSENGDSGGGSFIKEGPTFKLAGTHRTYTLDSRISTYYSSWIWAKMREMDSTLPVQYTPQFLSSTTQWIGGSDTQWTNTSNWTNNIPDSDGIVNIDWLSNQQPFIPQISTNVNSKVLYVGFDNDGEVNQSSGINQTDYLYLGAKTSSNGIYLLGGGEIQANDVFVGYYGEGQFTQSGGTFTIDENLHLGCGINNSGVFLLNNGTLSANNVCLGNGSNVEGSFTQTLGIFNLNHLTVNTLGECILNGGNCSISKILKLDGHLQLAGGSLSVENIDYTATAFICSNGTNLGFSQTAGTATFDKLTIESSGNYTLSYGSCSVTQTLDIGGEYQISAGSLSVGTVMTVLPDGEFKGNCDSSGTVSITAMDNSGIVQIDDCTTETTLDLSGIGSLSNTTDNPTNRGNGWYAGSKAKLTLPSTAVDGSSDFYNVGEAAGDEEIDLVNSVQLHDIVGLTSSGTLTASILSPDRSEIPTLNTSSIVGVWQVSASGLSCTSAQLTFRYDGVNLFNVRKEGTAKSLVLLRYDTSSSSWVAVTGNNGVDKSNCLLTSNVLLGTELPSIYAIVSAIPGDANLSCEVDVGDLGILAANYGGADKTWKYGDFNNDGLVDVGDLGILAANYGSTEGSPNAGVLTTSIQAIDKNSLPSIDVDLVKGAWQVTYSGVFEDLLAIAFTLDQAVSVDADHCLLLLRYDDPSGKWKEVTGSRYTTGLSISTEPLFTTELSSIYAAFYAIMGDASLDGMVDVGDLGILAANYGMTSGAAWETADFNHDDMVDVADLGVLAAHYGDGTGTPEDTADLNNDSVVDEYDLALAPEPSDPEPVIATMHIEVSYVDSPATNLERFNIRLVSDSSDYPLTGWDGDFTGILHQQWEYYDMGEFGFSLPNPVEGPETDTHYYEHGFFYNPNENNDLSGPSLGEGNGTYLNNAGFTFSEVSIDIAQIVVTEGSSFQITGDVANSQNTVFHFQVTADINNCGSFDPTN